MCIKIANTSKYRNDLHYQFHKEVLVATLDAGPDTLNIRPLYNDYNSAFQAQDVAFKRIVKSDYTEQLADLDSKRDAHTLGMFGIIDSCLNHFSEEVVPCARRVKIVVDTYGGKGIVRKSYNEQTATTTNLIQDLKSDQYKNDVAMLRIKDWLDELERINNELEALVKTRHDEKAAKTALVLKEERAKTDGAFRAISKRINALVEVEGTEKYAAYIRDVNLIIDRYEVTVNVRSGRAKAKKAAE